MGKPMSEEQGTELIKQAKLSNIILLRIESTLLAMEATLVSIELNTRPPKATAFTYTKRIEPISTSTGDPEMPNTFPGPVPPNSRVVVTVTSVDANGNPAKIDGTLITSRDDEGALTATELTEKTVWDIRVDPPTDLTHDTTVFIMDSDNAPADSFTIDWDGPVVIPTATGFITSIRTEPIS